ncbi:MAG TPA: hypothetical protein VGN75_10240 [Kaistia sp.]|jgi:hypothetical protein|nr:hypothetical protein [Kaistia sp.]
MNWQPIKTAPMDGETYILIYQANEDGTDWIDICRFIDNEWLDRHDDLSTEAPTHWAPLIAPAREG